MFCSTLLSLYLPLPQQHCTPILESIANHINNEHDEMSAHRLLSIFKMAEVQVIMPEVSSVVGHHQRCFNHVIVASLFVTIFLSHLWRVGSGSVIGT
jgi:hypothetical protein